MKGTVRLVCLFSLFVFNVLNARAQSPKKLKVGWHPNIETYFIAERLAVQSIGGYVFDIRNFDYSHQPMVTASFDHFKNYKDSAVILRMAAILSGFRDMFGDNLPILDYLLYQKSFPQKGYLYPYQFSANYNPEKKQLIQTQLQELTDSLLSFYTKAKVGAFLKQHIRFYEGAVAEVKKDINSGIYTAMEKYYGQQFKGYALFVTPTMPLTAGEDNYRGMGVSLNTGSGTIACMITSTTVMLLPKQDINQYSTFGFDNRRITQFLAVHEMIHSFVNPQLSKFTKEIDKDSALYTPALATLMKPQGIPNWEICLTEHFVRLGEIRIAEAMNDKKQAASLRRTHVDSFHFVLLPLLERQIKEYEGKRNIYPHFEDFIPLLLLKMHVLRPEDINELIRERKNQPIK